MYGGLVDRVHDLLLCGVDPSMVDLNVCLEHLKSEKSVSLVYGETKALLKASSRSWIPSHHAFLYGPEFRACIACVCLVKVKYRLDLASVLLLKPSDQSDWHISLITTYVSYSCLDPSMPHG